MTFMTVTVMSWKDWLHRVELSNPQRGKPVPGPNGYSPGGAAALLGVTRHAIHQAIRRGTMDATSVPVPSGGRYWFIADASLEAYKRDHLRFEPPKK